MFRTGCSAVGLVSVGRALCLFGRVNALGEALGARRQNERNTKHAPSNTNHYLDILPFRRNRMAVRWFQT
ncbi:unnamed protein product [Gemmata massiliana]|uniref:Uncharacterized protein n=1 Tax=Gemmata massiliana TaxID=1210884 RepID=A0A6P2DKJ0_9BACT|nr:unnamed protein product [Gemmata massiliana]